MTHIHNDSPDFFLIFFLLFIYLFIYLGFNIAFNTVQVISRRVVGRAEETSTYSWSRFCTINCGPTGSNYQISHFNSGRDSDSDFRGGGRVYYNCYNTSYKYN